MSGYTENWVSHHGVIPGGASFIGRSHLNTPMSLARKIREILTRRDWETANPVQTTAFFGAENGVFRGRG